MDRSRIRNFIYFHLPGWSVHVLMGGHLTSCTGRMVHYKDAPYELYMLPPNRSVQPFLQVTLICLPRTTRASGTEFNITCSDQSSKAFKEVAIIRHPHIGEYAFGFITSSIILRKSTGSEELVVFMSHQPPLSWRYPSYQFKGYFEA
ncbi:UNVERIFIED_CONTAM: protein LIKE COV 3 [Sesamum angustifolium]|uniref:Protein LIKE COV 3 n=1 Tax=Sesamum angustifolium TaxID=2727405 RepID=A0AAW2RMP0_9LAMI